MKLIIDIPEEEYKRSKLAYNYDSRRMDKYSRIIGNGTPLDDVKAEIISKHLHIVEKNDFDNGRTYGYDECLSILDNIGKAESEDKK